MELGHRGSVGARAWARRRLGVAIEDGTWRSVLSGGAAGSVTVGNGRRLDQPGGAGGRGGNRGPLGHQEAVGGDA